MNGARENAWSVLSLTAWAGSSLPPLLPGRIDSQQPCDLSFVPSTLLGRPMSLYTLLQSRQHSSEGLETPVGFCSESPLCPQPQPRRLWLATRRLSTGEYLGE